MKVFRIARSFNGSKAARAPLSQSLPLSDDSTETDAAAVPKLCPRMPRQSADLASPQSTV